MPRASRAKKQVALPAEEIPIEEVPIEQDNTAPEGEEIPISSTTEEAIDIEVEVHNHGQSDATTPGLQQMAMDLLRLVRENAERLGGGAAEQVQQLLKGGASDYLDPDFWRGIGMVLEYQVTELRGMIQRRLKGEYTTDAYGRDDEVIELMRPIAGFLYRSWWRIKVSGLEHVPADGGALFIANHAGVIPWDGAMLATALFEDHPSARLIRILHQKQISHIPILAPTLAALGQVPALPANAERLLAEGEYVGLFPEGSILFRHRYKLRQFEVGAYIQAGLRAGVPIVPVAVIGAAESYPVMFNLDKAAKLLGFPYLPITPLFPLAGLLGLMPLPSKWVILFGEPLDTTGYGPDAADDTALVARLNGTLRLRIEGLIERGLAERGSPFIG